MRLERVATVVWLAALVRLTWAGFFETSPYAGSLPALLALTAFFLASVLSVLALLRGSSLARVGLVLLEGALLVLVLGDGPNGDVLGLLTRERFGSRALLWFGLALLVLMVLLLGHLVAWQRLRVRWVVPLAVVAAAGFAGRVAFKSWAELTPEEWDTRAERAFAEHATPELKASIEEFRAECANPPDERRHCEARLLSGALESAHVQWNDSPRITWAELKARLKAP